MVTFWAILVINIRFLLSQASDTNIQKISSISKLSPTSKRFHQYLNRHQHPKIVINGETVSLRCTSLAEISQKPVWKTLPINIRGVSLFGLMIESLFSRFAIQTINSACFLESIDINFEFWFSQYSMLCHQSCKASFK